MILAGDRTCTHRLNDNPAGLACDRRDVHDPDARGGHTYHASDAPDGTHDDPAADQ